MHCRCCGRTSFAIWWDRDQPASQAASRKPQKEWTIYSSISPEVSKMPGTTEVLHHQHTLGFPLARPSVLPPSKYIVRSDKAISRPNAGRHFNWYPTEHSAGNISDCRINLQFTANYICNWLLVASGMSSRLSLRSLEISWKHWNFKAIISSSLLDLVYNPRSLDFVVLYLLLSCLLLAGRLEEILEISRLTLECILAGELQIRYSTRACHH